MSSRTVARTVFLVLGSLLFTGSLLLWMVGSERAIDSGDKTLLYLAVFGMIGGAANIAFVSTGTLDAMLDRRSSE